MQTNDFNYHLPPHHIAQTPVEPRDSSKLLVLDRNTGNMEHRRFTDLPQYLRDGDVLVFNNSRVIPARLHGNHEDTGGKAELLLISRLEPGIWKAVGKPGRRLKQGSKFYIETSFDNELWFEVLETGDDGMLTIRLSSEVIIEGAGQIPLPPYIHVPLSDPERYQTVYARIPGSVATPTAGLHFTPRLLDELKAQSVKLVEATLHVGLDTFRPIRAEDPQQHVLHGEYFEISDNASAEINAARQGGHRVIAVGTTSVRLLEQAAQVSERSGSSDLLPYAGWADLYILPGHKFRNVDAMITNFHLPRSTLLMMVSAFAGRELVLKTYHDAISKGYRFYSFGDAMLIL